MYEEVKAGRMSQGQAQDARHDAALKVQGAWSGGCNTKLVRRLDKRIPDRE